MFVQILNKRGNVCQKTERKNYFYFLSVCPQNGLRIFTMKGKGN